MRAWRESHDDNTLAWPDLALSEYTLTRVHISNDLVRSNFAPHDSHLSGHHSRNQRRSMGSTDGQSPPPPFRSPVKTWHNDTYPAISPTRPELSAHGKRVVITGGGTGIGRETAFAFATAGASSIFLLGGRRAHVLEKTNEAIQKQHPNVQVGYRALDIADVKAVNEAAIVIGSFDILVLNAAYSPANQKLLDADFEELGEGWTTNVIGNIHVLRALLPNRNTNASVINVSTALVSLPTEMLGGKALTTGMKIFMVKMLEVLAVEVPDCFFVSFHPGASKY